MMSAIVSALLLQSPTSVPPSQVAAYARIDQVSGYAVTAAACPRLGHTVSPDFPRVLQERATAEATSAGVPSETVAAWIVEAIRRQGPLFRQDMQRTVEAVEQGADPAPTLGRMFDRMAASCDRIGADPISVGIFTAASPTVVAETRRRMEDDLLQGYGKASWQTPRIFATGELLFSAGACKAVLPEAHDRVVARFMPESQMEERQRAYLSGQYVEGMRSAVDLGLSETQCARVLNAREQAVAEAR